MRILHVLDHSIPLHSGYAFRTLSIVREQRARGWQTVHVTGPKQGSSTPGEEVIDGLAFYRTCASWDQFPVLNQLEVVHRLRSAIVDVVNIERPDIIHAHSPALNGLAAVLAARDAGLPAVYEVRAFWEDAAVDHGTSREGGMRYRMTRGLESWVLKRANAVTTICEGLRSDIVERGISPERVTVIPNAVDVENFPLIAEKDAQLSTELSLDGRFVIGFIGSFYAYEGLPLALESLPQIIERRPEAVLLLVGGGPDEPQLRESVDKLGLHDHVRFTGRVPHEDVARYYSLIDLLVYPRYSMRLTELVTPLKPLEAMAQGIPFVASDIGGHRELVRDGHNGVLFPTGNATALADAVTSLAGDSARLAKLISSGREYVETERNWRASVARYETVYESAQSERMSA